MNKRTRRNYLRFTLALGAVLTVCGALAHRARTASLPDGKIPAVSALQTVDFTEPQARESAAASYGKLPIQFEANQGQTGRRVRFLFRKPGLGLFLTANEAVLALAKKQTPQPAAEQASSTTTGAPCHSQDLIETNLIRMKLIGSKSVQDPIGTEQLPGRVNYLIGNDPAKWHTNVSTYKRVSYRNVYPGIDLVYHGDQDQLEYDFVVAPGRSSKKIRLDFGGTERIEINQAGDLVLHIGEEQLTQRKPVAYQETNGARREIAVNYILHSSTEVGFALGDYDHHRPLTIDPVLAYSTYLGGLSLDQANAIAVNQATGEAFIAGSTTSSNFPTASAFDTTRNASSNSDVFVSKLNATGTALVYSTYLGDEQEDSANGIAIDSSGNAYVTGSTKSQAFPAVNPIQTYQHPAGIVGCTTNAFVTKLNPAGNGLVYSTFLGGAGDGPSRGDDGKAIAVDQSGNAYVAGSTYSGDFPNVNASQLAIAGNSIIKTTNGGGVWSPAETGLPKNSINTIAIDPKTPATLYAGVQHNGIWKSTDGGTTWARSDTGINANGGDITSIVIDPLNNSNVYAAGSLQNSITGNTSCLFAPGVVRSTDGGANWTVMSNGLPNQAGTSLSGQLAIDPQNPATLYVGIKTDGQTQPYIFKTTNGGANWNPSDNGISHATSFGGTIKFVAIDPINPTTLYAGSSVSGLYKSTDGGANWARIATSKYAANGPGPDSMVIDPTNTATLYTVGFGIDKSTDGGTTFSDIDTGLNSNLNNTSLAIEPLTPATLYLGTRQGMFKSTNGGANWALLNVTGANLPSVISVAVNPSNPPSVYATLLRQPDAFVARINSAGTALNYSTFVGGNDADAANGLAIDTAGNAYLTGSTVSLNYPTIAPFQAVFGGGNCGNVTLCRDAFVTKVSSSSALLYSTYLGGNKDDFALGIAVDSSGNAYLTGFTSSNNFPTANAFQPTLNSLFSNAFLTKLNAAGSSIVYSTYLGGQGFDEGTSVAVDNAGNATITGNTSSPDFPVVKPLQCFKGFDNAFVTRFNSSGSTLSYSTYLTGSGGGSFNSSGNGVALDAGGNVYVTGETRGGFPTVNPLQATYGGGNGDAFVSKLTLQGASGSDMVLAKCASANTDTSTTVGVGSNFTYTLYVTNSGPQTATAVTVTDTLPVGVSFVSATPSRGTCSGTSTITCNLGNINNDDAATITIVVKATQIRTVTNTGTVTVTSSDPTSANNSSSVSTQITAATPSPSPTPTPTPTPTATPTPTPNVVQFSAASYSVQEDCTFVTVTVNRTGDSSAAASVDYNSSDGTATDRRDYITALGKLQFAAGETSRTFVVLINEDSYVEGNETLSLTLSNPTGVSLGSPATATVTITDDASEPATNVIDDPANFVCQHYHDFLNRQPDQSGWDFWTNQITSCNSDASCIEARRINASAAFYVSIEFQQTGYLVERSYKAAYADAAGNSTFGGAHQLPVPVVRFTEFLSDTQKITKGVVVLQQGWEQLLENNKQAFFAEFVQRSRFTTAFPTSMTPAEFVDRLNQNAGNVLSASERTTAINLFSGAGNTTNTTARAQAVRQVAEDQDMQTAEFNRAFVWMQYVGYLRRNPNDPQDTDYTGQDFWLTKLNQFNGDYINAEMVKAFITSIEYRQRFGP